MLTNTMYNLHGICHVIVVSYYKGGKSVRSSRSMQQTRAGYNNGQVLDRPHESIAGRFSRQRTHPKRLDIFLHAGKTFRLIGALTVDWRVPLWRKALFFGCMGGLLIILFFPDLLNEAVMSTVLPLAGTVLGIPLDAGFDWIAFALAVVTLLHFFPAEFVAEHYRRIFS